MDTFYPLCHLIPTARDTETQRGLVTNLRTQSWHPGGRWAENPRPVPSAVLSPGCPPHAGSAGRATEQPKDQDPTQRPKTGLSDSSGTQTPELAMLGHLSLLGEVGVVLGQMRSEFGFHKPHISHQKAKLSEDSPVVRGRAGLQVLR